MILICRNHKKGIYEAKFTAEDATKMLELFGTNILPTAYLLTTKPDIVRRAISDQNKNTLVDLE